MHKVLDLFSGIGGFSLGLERTGGFETVAFCEIEPFPRKVLSKHWPDVPIYEDVHNVTKERLDADGIFPDVITAGFPCQDVSNAGNQGGIGAETRSGLWSQCARLVGELLPDFAIFENVTALLTGDGGRWFSRVLCDLASLGYDAEWHCIRASAIGARHHRDRVWIICRPAKSKLSTDTSGKRLPGFSKVSDGTETRRPIIARRSISRALDHNTRHRNWNEPEPGICRVSNGIPDGVHRIKGLGNAVVPQIPELIGKAIIEIKND